VRRNVAEDGVVTRIDLEEIDLSAAHTLGTSARQIRAGKKNVAKILARGQSIPSWKRSLAIKTRGWLGLKAISVEERFVEQHGIRRDRDWINPPLGVSTKLFDFDFLSKVDWEVRWSTH
jgi:hypothetical protein